MSSATKNQYENKYVDKTLLRLRRTYTENETIQAFAKRNTELQMKLGMMKSDLQEAEHERDQLKRKLGKAALSEVEPQSIQKLRQANKRLKKTNKSQLRSISEYAAKLLREQRENERLKAILKQHNIQT